MLPNRHNEVIVIVVPFSHFSDIIVPLQSAMTVTLPSSQGAHRDHDPFPMAQIFISSFDDVVNLTLISSTS